MRQWGPLLLSSWLNFKNAKHQVGTLSFSSKRWTWVLVCGWSLVCCRWSPRVRWICRLCAHWMDTCPIQHLHLNKGKEHYPSVKYKVVCTSHKFIQSVSYGHLGARNDKHVARTDVAIMNLFCLHGGLGSKSWSVIDAEKNTPRVFKGYTYCVMKVIIGWLPCGVYQIKMGLAGSIDQKWAAMQDLVRKDIEGVFGHLKLQFLFLKYFNRMHHQSDMNNAFMTCCSKRMDTWIQI